MYGVPCKFFAQNRCAKGDACPFSHDVKAKGKGKGKGKAQGYAEAGQASQAQSRNSNKVRISAEKFSGTIVTFKGKYGFIKPDEEIPHEKASLNHGNLFFGKDDIQGSSLLTPGTPVLFHICESDTGLGAQEVEKVGDAPKGASKGATGKETSKGVAGKTASKTATSTKSSAKGAGKGQWEAGGWVPIKGWEMLQMAKGLMSMLGKGTGTIKGKGKGKNSTKGKGHLLPRTRISAEKFTGTVSGWKGKYGWIKPSEEIEHEKASKHDGSLFVSKDDLVGIDELKLGASVEFHIWEDASGLGADEVVQL